MDVSLGAVTVEEGFKAQKWDILGQIYTPLHVTQTSFAIHAVFPAGTFVPRHIHDTQDEFFHMLEGTMVFELDGKEITAGPGTHLTMPMGVPHAIYNRSDRDVTALVVVSPTRRFYEYMQKIDGMTDRDEMARLAAVHEVPFV
ncbi:cupin domain-containing protein [Shinella sp. NM-101]|uniref:cupin domain-containing protein n=1 Tax=Shinella sp. NM-101 TaxID=2744455 RepID=UPI001ACC2F82|nr:cupin domain-containing protein [Shinella sp. NM-101]MBN9055160.1 cupin domain-containing protein [Hyphomicrobiales bacterium]